MSVYTNTGINLSESYYLRSYYKKNQNMCKSAKRNEYPNTQLSYEDGRALRRAAKNLSSYEYSDSENKTNISNSILAYVDTYNNTIDSAKKSSDYSISRYSKQLKNLAKEHSEEFEAIGITVNSDGSMKANENLVKKASITKLQNLFGKDSNLTKTTDNYAKKVANKSYDNIYSQITGNGQGVNIIL